MKRTLMLAGLVFAASLVLTHGAPAPQDLPSKALRKIHEWNAVIVSVDVVNESVTFKDEKGETVTVPASVNILGKLKQLKPGEKVNLTCEDDPNGVHESIVKFKPVKTGAK